MLTLICQVIRSGVKYQLARSDRVDLRFLIYATRKEAAMSGHSRWSQIKRQKQSADIKRGVIFSKIATAITVAVKQGGGDPQTNFRLRLLLNEARGVNMPKDKVQAAIDRGLGKGEAVSLEEVLYEGYGPAGIAVVAEVVTDNRNRTTSEIKNVLERSGGSLGGPNSVSWMFEKKGLISLKSQKSFDEVFLAAADSGAEDVQGTGDSFEIYTKAEEVENVRKNLELKGFEILSSELTFKPKNIVKVEDAQNAQKVLGFMDKLDGLDFVQKVYSNFDIPEELLVKSA